MINVLIYGILNKEIGGEEIKVRVMQIKRWLLKTIKDRIGVQKGRGEVSYSNKKMFVQKGRGKARIGDKGSPILIGGGRVFPGRIEERGKKKGKVNKKEIAMVNKIIILEKRLYGKLGISWNRDKKKRKERERVRELRRKGVYRLNWKYEDKNEGYGYRELLSKVNMKGIVINYGERG